VTSTVRHIVVMRVRRLVVLAGLGIDAAILMGMNEQRVVVLMLVVVSPMLELAERTP